jgi:peptidoglycan hydrolase-like protein with peptidoglycan-binding domain
MKKLIILLLIFPIIFVFDVNSFADLNDGLVAYYPFNGNANDESGNGYFGTEHGGIIYVDGVAGQAVKLDGVDGFIESSYYPVFKDKEPFSISLWIKGNEQVNSVYLYGFKKANKSGIGIFNGTEETNRYFYMFDDNRLVGKANCFYTSNILDNSWHHIVAVRNTKRVSLYIDGKFITGTLDITSGINLSPSRWIAIGANNHEIHNVHGFFDGVIDEFRIYNRALTIAEIQELATVNQSIPTIEKGKIKTEPDKRTLPIPSYAGDNDSGNKGSHHELSKILCAQTELKRLGHYNNKIDGIFGDRTKSAIYDFQYYNNLPETGRLDLQTSARLGCDVDIIVNDPHTNTVNLVKFSPDGKLLLTFDGKELKIWNTENGNLIKTIRDQYVGPGEYGFTNNNHLVQHIPGKIIVYRNSYTGRVFSYSIGNSNLVLSEDGSVAAFWNKKNITFYNYSNYNLDSDERAEQISEITNKAKPISVSLSSNGNFASAFYRTNNINEIVIYSISDGSILASKSFDDPVMKDPIAYHQVSPDGKLVAIVMKEDEFTVWSVEDWRIVKKFDDRFISIFGGCNNDNCFSGNGKLMVICEDSHSPKVYNTSTWELVAEYENNVTSMAFSPNKPQIAIGKGGWQGTMPVYQNYNVSLWNIENNESHDLTPDATWVNDVILSPNGKYIAIIDETSFRLRLLNINTGQIVLTTHTPEVDIRREEFSGISSTTTGSYITYWQFTQDSRYIICNKAEEPFIFVLDISNKSWFTPFPLPMMAGVDVLISNDGEAVAIVGEKEASPSAQNAFNAEAFNGAGFGCYVYRSKDGKEIFKIENNKPGRYISKMAINSNGKLLVYVERVDKKYALVKLWDLNNKRLLMEKSLEYIDEPIRFSEDGLFISYGKLDWSFNGTELKRSKRIKTTKQKTYFDNKKLSFYFEDTDLRNAKHKKVSMEDGIGMYTNNILIRDSKLTENWTDYIAKLICFEDGIILLTPEGFFSGSREMGKYIYFLKGQKAYGINQFYDVFYRPDLVAKKIKGEDITKYVRSLRINEALKYPPPDVKIFIPKSGESISNDKAKVKIKITDTGGGIGDVRLYHNGKLIDSRGVYRIAKIDNEVSFLPTVETTTDNVMSFYKTASRGISVYQLNAEFNKERATINAVKPITGHYEKSYDINLIGGRNIITACAFNGSNTVMSSMVSIDVNSTMSPQKPTLYALLIGNDHFKNDRFNLSYAIKDSKDFATVLNEVATSLFIKTKIIQLSDASKLEILKEFKTLSLQVRPEDIFIFFVASHGSAEDDLYFIYTSDFNSLSRFESSSISSIEIMEYSKLIPALKHIYIFDTCQSGGIGSVVLGLYDVRMSVLASSLGMHIFAGSKTYQAALDGYKENGLFTHFLLEGARGQADRNNDKIIEVFELKPYLEQQLSKASYGTQEPFIRTFGENFAVFQIN